MWGRYIPGRKDQKINRNNTNLVWREPFTCLRRCEFGGSKSHKDPHVLYDWMSWVSWFFLVEGVIDYQDQWFQPHRIHVWYIYLLLVDFYGKCRYIYHTWILWELSYLFTHSLRKMNPILTIWWTTGGWNHHHLSHEKKKKYFPLDSGCLVRILIMAYIAVYNGL